MYITVYETNKCLVELPTLITCLFLSVSDYHTGCPRDLFADHICCQKTSSVKQFGGIVISIIVSITDIIFTIIAVFCFSLFLFHCLLRLESLVSFLMPRSISVTSIIPSLPLLLLGRSFFASLSPNVCLCYRDFSLFTPSAL